MCYILKIIIYGLYVVVNIVYIYILMDTFFFFFINIIIIIIIQKKKKVFLKYF